MIRMFLCAAAQIAFVAVYGTWAALRPEAAFGWMLPFVVVVWALVLHNEWRAIAAGVRALARRVRARRR